MTGYGQPLEPQAPAEAAARTLAGRIGPDRLVWRYDPVVLGPGLDHERYSAHDPGCPALVEYPGLSAATTGGRES